MIPKRLIATNILADRLGNLEGMGFITKERNHKSMNQFIYSMTPNGQSLSPLLIEMTLWGLQYDHESLASKEFIERVRDEKTKVIREIGRAIKRGNFSTYRSEKMGIHPQ